MGNTPPKRILILGGGFAGLSTAMELEKVLATDQGIEVTMVNRENFFLFTPMLHEVAASDLDLTTIVNPARKMLRRVNFFAGEVNAINLPEKKVVVAHGFDHHAHTLEYDFLVLGLGSTTNFYGLPGLEERALTMKSLSDAMRLRNHLIAHLEEAASECCKVKNPLLTFVVAGGGFAGVETIAGINDFVRGALKNYPNLTADMVRVVLVHPGGVILPELGEKLGNYAQRKLAERKVEIRVNTRVTGVTDRSVSLSDGTVIYTNTLVWTAGTSPNPLYLICYGIRSSRAACTPLACHGSKRAGSSRFSHWLRELDHIATVQTTPLILGNNSPSHPRSDFGVMGISHQESGTTNAGRQVSIWRCPSACVLRLDYRTLADLSFPIWRRRLPGKQVRRLI